MNSRHILLSALTALFLASCAEDPKKEDSGPEIMINKEEKAKKAPPKAEIPVDMENKGIGPITSYAFSEEINQEMAAAGEETFNSLCIACHEVEKRSIGPAISGLYERRSPEWVLNMILNPMQMINEDPIAKALYEDYGAIMAPQGLTEQQAKEVAEYMRTL